MENTLDLDFGFFTWQIDGQLVDVEQDEKGGRIAYRLYEGRSLGRYWSAERWQEAREEGRIVRAFVLADDLPPAA